MIQTGIQQILIERSRQIEVEEYKPAGDRGRASELAAAAKCYRVAAEKLRTGKPIENVPAKWKWPWDLKYWKPSTAHRGLVKAGALYEAARAAADTPGEALIFELSRDRVAAEIDWLGAEEDAGLDTWTEDRISYLLDAVREALAGTQILAEAAVENVDGQLMIRSYNDDGSLWDEYPLTLTATKKEN